MKAAETISLNADNDDSIKVIQKHDLLVRISHWANIPVLTALILSGLSIYWASPVITVPTPDGNIDIFALVGRLFLQHFPDSSEDERNWFYNHFAFGARHLAYALNIHWLCAYLYMFIAGVYTVGLIRSGAYRALLPRKTDVRDGLKMFLNRIVPTYTKADITEVPNNFAGQTPDKAFISDWKLFVSGLAGGVEKRITSSDLRQNFVYYDQITRLVCVEGWSAISWWGGIRFVDFIKQFPPGADTKWIQLRSEVNLDGSGNPDPYYVSLDLHSALHPQTLLVTHHNGRALELEHGAPLRLLAPMKLGLKNIKAVTSIAYSSKEPDDYWNKDGYSYYDGI